MIVGREPRHAVGGAGKDRVFHVTLSVVLARFTELRHHRAELCRAMHRATSLLERIRLRAELQDNLRRLRGLKRPEVFRGFHGLTLVHGWSRASTDWAP
ncbi:MAG: hypothetical protein JNK82_41850 [Myxococcaceae bacterium]|nr:hypothetical protein [Myxococcaceae bacterium]